MNANIMNSQYSGGDIYSAGINDCQIEESIIEGCLLEDNAYQGPHKYYDDGVLVGEISTDNKMKVIGQNEIAIGTSADDEAIVIKLDQFTISTIIKNLSVDNIRTFDGISYQEGYSGIKNGLIIANGIIIGEA